MATIRTVSHECDRCMFGKVRPATHLGVDFTIDNVTYSGDLCDEHHALLQRDFGPWRACFAAQDEPEVVELASKRRFVTTDEVEASRRAAELRSAEADRREADRKAVEDTLRSRALEVERLRRTIPGARSWTITGHARKRMIERNFGPEEVLRAVAQPQLNYPADAARHGPGRYIYERGDVRAVVDPRGKTVITVIDRNDHWDVRPGAERIAQ